MRVELKVGQIVLEYDVDPSPCFRLIKKAMVFFQIREHLAGLYSKHSLHIMNFPLLSCIILLFLMPFYLILLRNVNHSFEDCKISIATYQFSLRYSLFNMEKQSSQMSTLSQYVRVIVHVVILVTYFELVTFLLQILPTLL